MKIPRLLLVLLVFIIASPMALAVAVSGLFDTQIPVSDQSAATEQAAEITGLLQVLVRISGNPAIGTVPSIQNNLKQAANYLQSYQYQNGFLDLRFNQNSVLDLLQQSGQAVWGQDRPLSLIWLVQQTPQGLQPIGADPKDAVADALQQAAKQRGLPITFPLYDVTDWQQIQLQSIMTPDVQGLQKASARYHANAILIGILKTTPEHHYAVSWTLLVQGDRLHWDLTADDPKQLMNNSLDTIMTALADRFATINQAATTTETLLTVTDIQSVDQFAALLQYLKHLTPVKQVNIVAVTPTQVIYRMVFSGDVASLTRAIALDPQLVPAQPQDNLQPNHLMYRLAT